MTTPGGDSRIQLLPADDLVAIYDTSIKILYLYARGKWHPARLIGFVRQPSRNSVKYAFQASFGGGDDGGSDDHATDDPLPPPEQERQFAEGLHIDLAERQVHYHDVLIETLQFNDSEIRQEPKVVPIVYIPIIQ